jgi:hypothetical protein
MADSKGGFMKIAIFSILMALAAGSAFASPITCSDARDRFGFSVHFSANLSSAQVTQETSRGPKVLANLACTQPTETRPSRPGQDRILAACFEPLIRDAGYSVILRVENGNGSTTSTLSQVTFAGSHPIAELVCQ